MKTTKSGWQATFLVSLGSVLAAMSILGQSVRRDDFRVSDEDLLNTGGEQSFPDVAASAGGYTVVWRDDPATGVVHIQAQLYDTRGEAEGATFKVNDDVPATSLKGPPRVARQFPSGAIGDPFGTSVVVWEHGRDDLLGDVFAQIYNHTSGRFIGVNFRISDVPANRQADPAVAMWPSPNAAFGPFVVVWTDKRDGNDDVYGRVFNRDFDGSAKPAGQSFRVNDDVTTTDQTNADVGMAADGSFVVVWRDFRNTISRLSEIWAQRYANDGTKVGTNFQVDTNYTGAVTPRIAVEADGGFVITYVGALGNTREIAAQRYTKTGELDGLQAKVNQGNEKIVSFPTVTFLLGPLVKSRYLVTWEATVPAQPGGDILMQCIDDRGQLVGDNRLLSVPDASAQNRADVATLRVGHTNPQTSRSMVVFSDDRIGDPDIWSQTVIECDPDGANFLVNGRSSGRVNQRHPAIGTTAQGQSVVVWEDGRSVASRTDIYGKRLAPNGEPLGPSFKINTDSGPAVQAQPDVAVHPVGDFVAVWTDQRDDARGDIYLQRFNAAGAPVGNNVLVNSATPPGGQHSPAVSIRQDGVFAVTWIDSREAANGQTFVQWFAADGTPRGGNVRVDTDTKGTIHRDPALAFLESGELIVAWSDAREDDLDIWAQRYDADGTPSGINFRVNTPAANMQVLPAIDAAPGGVFLIAWVDYRKTAFGDIWAQRFDKTQALGVNFQVNDVDNVANPEPAEFPYGPSVAAVPASGSTGADNTFVVSWTDFRISAADPNIFAQRYASEGAPVGSNFRVDNAASGTRQYFVDGARDALSPNGLYFAWTDERNLNTEGESIWAKILEWDGSSQTKIRIQLSASRIAISWPAELTDYRLESSADLSAANSWQPVPEAQIVITGGTKMFSLEPSGQAAFFRLRKP